MYLQTRSITACMFAQSWLPSAYLQSWSIMASKCISNSLDYGLHKCLSKLARYQSRSASLSLLEHSRQVYFQIHSITAYKCISKVARARPPSASLSSLDLSLQVYIQTGSITAPKCISEFTRSLSPSPSHTHSIKNIFKERWRLYGDTVVQ